jgi:hypothetical protein
MRCRRLIVPLVAAMLFSIAGGGAADASIPGTTLALSGLGRMLVDPSSGQLFVTGNSSDSTVLARNADGSAAGSISGESGASGMVLDGTTLYVARCGWSVIDVIDTTTLTKTGSISAPNIGGTCDIVEAGGALWYTNSSNRLVSVTLDASHTTTVTSELVDGPLAATSTNPNWLVGVFSEAYVKLYDVTDPTAPSLITSVFSPDNGDAINDITITPDGADVMVASGAPYEVFALSLPDLSMAGTYPTAPYPNAVAVSPDGSLIAGGGDGIYNKDVWLFPAGNSTAKGSWDFGGTSDTLWPRGLAFSADGKTLYAASKGSSGASVILHVLSTSGLKAGSLTVTASKSTVLAGHSLTITAHLGTTSTNKTVSIYRTPVGGSETLVSSGTVNSKGNLVVTLHPKATASYTAVWTGDTTHSQTTAPKTTVKVRLVARASAKLGYRTVSGVRLYHYASSCTGSSHTNCPTILTSSTPLLPGHQFNLVVQAKLSGSWRTILTGSHTTGSDGKLAIIIYYNNRAVIGVPQRIRFTYPKDAAHLGNTSPWANFRVTT